MLRNNGVKACVDGICSNSYNRLQSELLWITKLLESFRKILWHDILNKFLKNIDFLYKKNKKC
jgi:hypothetical protein